VAKENKIQATGRRKTAVASVFLTKGNGTIIINGRSLNNYFPTENVQNLVKQPLVLTKNESNLDIKAKLTGGGITSQAGALRHGISRALVESDESLKDILKNSGFLTRDPRAKERKKTGQPGARKRFQFSKR
jgi:small subunit ribosomal protein S9